MSLLFVHVLLATAGYAGLIAVNVYVLMMCQGQDASTFRQALTAWRKSSQVFGPMLGLGVILGFGVAATLHVPLTSRWLYVTYALMVAAIGVQAGIMAPWQVRNNRALLQGVIPSTGPVVFVLVSLSAIYTAIVALMVFRPA